MEQGAEIILFLQIHSTVVMTPFGSDANKQSGCELPTMVLSEARGLSLFLVVRGAYG
jgi:hypothetical protein